MKRKGYDIIGNAPEDINFNGNLNFNELDDIDISEIVLEYNQDYCPVCSLSIQPIVLMVNSRLSKEMMKVIISIAYKCPNNDCNEVFINYYEMDRHDYTGYKIGCASINSSSIKFDDKISEISENFVSIYREAKIAEESNLKQICGPGYRKALELLIKDYLILLSPENEKEIKGKFLGNCIRDYDIASNIKEMAKRAVWLGNDETHYERKWEDKDLEDLKRLIDIVVYWIMMEESTNEYKLNMNR